MLDFLLTAVLPVYAIILVGLVVRKAGVLGESAGSPLMSLVVTVLFPCLILDKICGNAALQHTPTILWAAGLGFAGVAAGYLICYLGGRHLIGLGRGGGLRTFAMSAGLQNYGFIAIPVLAAVFPRDETMGVLFLHNLGVEVAMWTLGLMLLRGSWRASFKVLANGPILAVIAGVVLVKTGLDARIPETLRLVMSQLGACAIPLALVLVGMTMADLAGKERLSFKISAAAVFFRLGVVAALILAAARYLPVAVELKEVLIVQAAMPAAVFSIVLARHYGGQPGTAIQVTLATGIAALFTIPWVLAFGRWWVLGGLN